MKTYRKTMTRDNGLIVQGAWSYAFEEGFEKTTGLKNPFAPTLIYHIFEGANEIWEQDEAFAWFKTSLLELNKKDPEFFNKCLEEYNEILKAMEQHRIKQILNLEELKQLVKHLHEASRLFAVLYYSAYDEQTPGQIKDKALDWREKDELYDVYEKVIKKSITNIAPWTKGLELVVNVKDLTDKTPKEVLQQRFKESIFIPGKLIETISIDDFCSKHQDYTFITEKPTKKVLEGVLTGQVACQGIAQGKVRILRRKSQIKDLQKGEVLVSPMTTPDFVPAMERSSAIVTDEGGITCHAAIVSREFKIPCIVGTKFATEILHDGDLVEVDAYEGTVKILKKSDH